MNESVYLGLSILGLSKTVMCEDYAKLKYDENAKFCYMDTDIFISRVKKDNIFVKMLQKML